MLNRSAGARRRPVSGLLPLRALALCLCLVAVGCSTRNLPEDAAPRFHPRLAHMRDAGDVRRFPQDLRVFAEQEGEEKRLLPPEEQERQAARFERVFFGPWRRPPPSLPAEEPAARFGKGPKGFDENARPWTRRDWEDMRANANLAAYPSVSLPGITLRRTLMRELPTMRARMSGPRPAGPDNPFDMFQYSALPLGTPLHIAHASADGNWYFALTPIASGWIPAADAAPADGAFTAEWRRGSYAAVIRDDVPVRVGRASSGSVHVGDIFPLRARRSKSLEALVPVRDARGWAAPAPVEFSRAQAGVWPLPLIPAWLAAVGNQMMGQPYGWGGMYEGRDCSAAVRDLFAPFGIWLPRNSAAQGAVGRRISLEGTDPEGKEDLIARAAPPFMSLLWMRGHIMLYLGRYGNENAVFHNVWGLRVSENGDADGRHVIGRGVVTSLRLGAELPGLKDGTRLIDRLRSIAVLPPAAN
jgi:hypothetical protein